MRRPHAGSVDTGVSALARPGSDVGADRGLDEASVEQRRRQGLVNSQPAEPSRTFVEILRANVFTRFNAILGALLVVIVVVGPLRDGLFGVVLVANTAIGVVQGTGPAPSTAWRY